MILSRNPVCVAVTALVLVGALLGGCKPGGESGSVDAGGAGGAAGAAGGAADSGCTGSCAGPTSFLTVADVNRVLDQAAAEATALGLDATIAVVDRVGNVLGVIRKGPAGLVTITSGLGVAGGLENAMVPDNLAAISKAVTGAYLASEGNAFTTRTASQIVQEHFNPGEIGQPGGPLFGVQFSQLAWPIPVGCRCSRTARPWAGSAPSPMASTASI
jgi:hypothetical protein